MKLVQPPVRGPPITVTDRLGLNTSIARCRLIDALILLRHLLFLLEPLHPKPAQEHTQKHNHNQSQPQLHNISRTFAFSTIPCFFMLEIISPCALTLSSRASASGEAPFAPDMMSYQKYTPLAKALTPIWIYGGFWEPRKGEVCWKIATGKKPDVSDVGSPRYALEKKSNVNKILTKILVVDFSCCYI